MMATPDVPCDPAPNPVVELLAWLRWRLERAVRRDIARGNDRPAKPASGESDE